MVGHTLPHEISFISSGTSRRHHHREHQPSLVADDEIIHHAGFRALEAEECQARGVCKENAISTQTELFPLIPGITSGDERMLIFGAVQPYIYVIVFINPYSGGRLGQELLDLKFQHFRLRDNNRVQIQWFNMFDDKDRTNGLHYLRWILVVKDTVQGILKNTGRRYVNLYAIDEEKLKTRNPQAKSGSVRFYDDQNLHRLSSEDQAFIKSYGYERRINPLELHVWSAGGDGTVMSVYDMLVSEGISFSSIYFSCIPFGTGNDMSQALGWERTLSKTIVSDNLSQLISLTERRLTGNLALLDVWEVEVTVHDEGYLREIHKGYQDKPKQSVLRRRFCSLFSMGVQGFVGMEFEPRRTKSRVHNIMQYSIQSAKWVLTRKFPVITEIIESIERDGEIIMRTKLPRLFRERVGASTQEESRNRATQGISPDMVPTLEIHPIDFIIQNIPHIWGRPYDLWGEAKDIPGVVSNRQGPTDSKNWIPQSSGDNNLELFAIENVRSYIRKQLSAKGGLARIGQIENHFTLHCRDPKVYQECTERTSRASRRRRKIPPGYTCLMIDGEFYELYLPKAIKFRRHSCIRAIGSDERTSRLVRDTTHSLQELLQQSGPATASTSHVPSFYGEPSTAHADHIEPSQMPNLMEPNQRQSTIPATGATRAAAATTRLTSLGEQSGLGASQDRQFSTVEERPLQPPPTSNAREFQPRQSALGPASGPMRQLTTSPELEGAAPLNQLDNRLEEAATEMNEEPVRPENNEAAQYLHTAPGPNVANTHHPYPSIDSAVKGREDMARSVTQHPTVDNTYFARIDFNASANDVSMDPVNTTVVEPDTTVSPPGTPVGKYASKAI
ncbi:hypothetical protein IWQ62_002102 [Dispira parvispora]|uniref:DAGKc domain-containing protein n=1 Tax=Dispira parvispora TaxID=1520584 RepID=A0A9W8AXH5_9FUNG|nr:hypothetical protein IWQ62_002102 [Dispira parvispora]